MVGLSSIVGPALSIAGGLFGGKSKAPDMTAFDRHYQMQKEFAQHGIRWRVEDAKKAGIHPLYALGAPSFSPGGVSVGGSSSGSNRGDVLASMGQDISRAIMSTRTNRERSEQAHKLQLEHGALQNELLRAQIRSVNARLVQQSGPPMPDALTPPPALKDRTVIRPSESVATDPNNPAKEAFKVPDFTFAHTASGLAIVPSESVKERIEDQMIPEIGWAMRNTVLPNFNPDRHRPDPRIYDPGAFRKWVWNPLTQTYQSRPLGRPTRKPGSSGRSWLKWWSDKRLRPRRLPRRTWEKN